MKKLKEKFVYSFDNLMSKGTVSLVAMLFLITFIVVVVLGIISFLISDGTIGDNIWISLMHTIDAGTIAGDDTSNGLFILVMSLVTLSGLFITSILIGIITTGFEEKLNQLKKGNSNVLEKEHTIILGYNDNIFTIIKELIIANENKKKPRIVVLAEEDKETIETAIKEQIEDFKNTKVICRTGNSTDMTMLEKVSITTAKSIIINEEDDYKTIKSILVLNSFLKEQTTKPYIVATINDEKNYEVAKLAGEDNTEIIITQTAISKIVAQACRQPGLSTVLVELFDYDGNELYFENFEELEGTKFIDVLNLFNKAIVFGYKRKDKININPSKNDILKKDDQLILLVEDDNTAKPSNDVKEVKDYKKLLTNKKEELKKENILILGDNKRLVKVIEEIDNYYTKDSLITIANNHLDESIKSTKLNNIKLNFIECDISNKEELNNITNKDITQILLLSDDKNDKEESDSEILLRLIQLRDIKEKNNYKFLVTSEMNKATNQKLAEVTKVNDLVIGSNIINLIVTQVSENRDLKDVFDELLQSYGSEIYTKKITNYIKTDKEVDFYTLTKIVADKDQVLIGYKQVEEDTFNVILNPNKEDKIKFTDKDELIILSKE